MPLPRRGIVGKAVPKEHRKAYQTWSAMMDRCDIEKKGTVCKQWLNFDNFLEWFEKQPNAYTKGFILNRYILGSHCCEYNPAVTRIVPRHIALLIQEPKLSELKRELPVGVYIGSHVKDRSKASSYYASCNVPTERGNTNRYLGAFKTPMEAFEAYKKVKQETVKDAAGKAFREGHIDVAVYHALLTYKILPYI